MKRDNKYDRIISAATALISAKGYERASLQQIADKVGLHKSTLYHYLTNKEELLLKIFGKCVDDVIKNLESINVNNKLEPEEKIKKAVDNHLTLMAQYFESVNIYLNQTKSLSRKNQVRFLKEKRKYEGEFEKIVFEMKKKGYFKGLDVRIVVFGLLGMLNWVSTWYKRDGRLSIKEISNVFYKMIVRK